MSASTDIVIKESVDLANDEILCDAEFDDLVCLAGTWTAQEYEEFKGQAGRQPH